MLIVEFRPVRNNMGIVTILIWSTQINQMWKIYVIQCTEQQQQQKGQFTQITENKNTTVSSHADLVLLFQILRYLYVKGGE